MWTVRKENYYSAQSRMKGGTKWALITIALNLVSVLLMYRLSESKPIYCIQTDQRKILLVPPSNKNLSPNSITLTGEEIDRIRGKVFAEGCHEENPMLVFLGGGTASGKSTSKRYLIDTGVIPGHHHVNIDPDDIMTEIDSYNKAVHFGDICSANNHHQISSRLSYKFLEEAIENRNHIILDRTMSGLEKHIRLMNLARGQNYTIILVGVSTSIEVAATRAAERARATGRWIPLHVIVDSHTSFSRNFMEYAAQVDTAFLFENIALGRPTQFLFSSADYKTLDWEAFSRFTLKMNQAVQDIEKLLPEDIRLSYEAIVRECFSQKEIT